MPTPAPAPPQRSEGQPISVVAPIPTTPVTDLLGLPKDTSGYWLAQWLVFQQLRSQSKAKITINSSSTRR